MRTLSRAVGIALLFPICSVAAEIYGTISVNGQPVKSEPVKVSCDGESPGATTDAFGSYRVLVRAQGRCRLSVKGLEAEVRSYSNAVRYDFEIRTQDGKTVLQRR